MNDKQKSILAIMLIISTLSGIFLYSGIRLYQRAMDEKIADTTEKINLLVDEVIQNSNSLYDVRLEVLTGNRDILAAFSNRNREALYEAALPAHRALKAENPYYSNMHFHLPSGRSFLRVHKPNEFGDDLRQIRPIIMKVHETWSPVSGYEIGKHGLFYRVARPVFMEGRYIGAVEIGISVYQVVQKIEPLLHIKVARIIDSRILNDAFKRFRQSEIQTQGFYINPYQNKAFFNRLVKAYDFKDNARQNGLISDRHFVAYTSGALNDFEGRTISNFLIAQDITDEIHGYQAFVARSIGLTLILIAGAYIILHFSFGSYINKIIELNITLENRVKERTKDLEAVTEELNQIFNTAADGMRVIDRQFNVLRVNDVFVRLTGKSQEALLSDQCHEHFRGGFCFSPGCTLTRILNGESRLEVDVERVAANGEKRSFILTATPFKSADGTILGVVENFRDITQRKKVFQSLKENEHYLNAIMATVQAGVIITDDKSPWIIDANPYAAKLIGCSRQELKNASIRDFFGLEKPWIDSVIHSGNPFEKEDCILTTTSGERLNIRLSVAKAEIRGKTYLVQSFSDITDVKRLLEMQTVDIHKAKSIMHLINPCSPRHVSLPDGSGLFTGPLSIPCNAEGGDHLFVRHFMDQDRPRTVISLKDQSGHEVNCILRSIFTDLIHNAVLFNNSRAGLGEVMTRLNTSLHESCFFDEDDYFTAVTAEIDHRSLMLESLSAGHPPFLLIRNRTVFAIPGPDHPVEAYNLPIPFLREARYVSNRLQLEHGDQLIFYTDGLTEMPIRNLKKTLSSEELKGLAQSVIDGFEADQERSMPVSLLADTLLERISQLSNETVLPGQNGSPPVNSSADDVSIIGVEIEQMENIIEKTFFPKDSEDLARLNRIMLDAVFESRENQAYGHLRHRMKMILEEAVVNAWKHGNRMDPEKSIMVRVSSRNDFLLEVIDQGTGFDFSSLPDPTSEGNIEKQSGRGIFIIRHFSDQVQWKKNGRHVIICVRKLKDMDDRENMEKQPCSIRLWETDQNLT